jgi:hypothetical protein
MDIYEIYKLEVWAGDEEGTWDKNNWFYEQTISVDNHEQLERYVKEYYIKAGVAVVFDYSYESCVNVVKAEDGYPLLEIQLKHYLDKDYYSQVYSV